MKKRAKTRIGDTSARIAEPKPLMECGGCWRVYDPAEGDPVWRIEPGVAFADIRADWRCPKCDAPREKFLRRQDGPRGDRRQDRRDLWRDSGDRDARRADLQ